MNKTRLTLVHRQHNHFFTVLLGLLCTLSIPLHAQLPITLFESSGGKYSPGYANIIDWWEKLDAQSRYVHMRAMDTTDAGYPLHLVLVSSDGRFNITDYKKAGKNILLINNGIHPGEPDGIDASMLLVKEIATGRLNLPPNVVLAIIPVYNIGGSLNRSANYRIDQEGPAVKGFRGNAANYDLNRDFIKMDSKEALAFARIFHLLDPDIFIDDHVSNGADYQHVMTLLTTQKDKMGPAGQYLHEVMEPAIYQHMQQKGFPLVPYVNHWGDQTPDAGWSEFWDSPRYGSGYAALFQTFAFVPETHMLKPYTQRVKATLELIKGFIAFTAKNGAAITKQRQQARAAVMQQDSFPLHWKVDSTQPSTITFLGYEAGYKTSNVSGLPRRYYDRSKPYSKQIPFYNHYTVTQNVQKPKAYLIPQGWWKVIDRLKANNVRFSRLTKDTTLQVQWYRVEGYTAAARPYEGHHINQQVKVSTHRDSLAFLQGDYLVYLDQPANRFLVETLEPEAEDSYFTWNFFDAILQQKEYFSDYVFEETAAAYLQQHPEVKQELEARRSSDSSFAKSAAAQLDFVYRHSPYYEPAHLRYPVYRIF